MYMSYILARQTFAKAGILNRTNNASYIMGDMSLI